MKPWQRALLKVPKVGLAYRAFRWQRITRKFNVVKITRLTRKIRKAVEENPDMIAKALKSKTVWLGIGANAIGVLELYQAGTLTTDVAMDFVVGVLIIVLRFVTDKPISAK